MVKKLQALQSLLLGVILIAGFSATLLIYDWPNRTQPEELPAPDVQDEALPFTGRPMAEEGKQYAIGICYFTREKGAETALAGLLDGLRDLGYVEGKNLTIERREANGEAANINPALEALDAGEGQAVVTLSSPVLSGALTAVRNKPVVFTHVIDPIAAGAGENWNQQRPNVTGIGSFPPLEATLDLFSETFPGQQKLATLYNSGETNSSKVVAKLRELAKERGITFEEKTVATPNDIGPAVKELVAGQPTALYIPGDDTVWQKLDTVLQMAAKAKVPVIIDAPTGVDKPGVLAAVGVGHYFAGKETAEPLAQVLRGMKPANIPMRNYTLERVVLNFDTAEKLGIDFPGPVMILHDPESIPSGSIADQRSPFQPPAATETPEPATQ